MSSSDLRKLYKERRRADKQKDDMIKALSESQSNLLTEKEKNMILAEINETHKQKLIDSEFKEDEYKSAMDQLQYELEQKKGQIHDISSQNYELQQKLEKRKNEMMTVTKQLSGKLTRLQEEKQKLQELIFEMQYERKYAKINGTSPLRARSPNMSSPAMSPMILSVNELGNTNYIETEEKETSYPSNKTSNTNIRSNGDSISIRSPSVSSNLLILPTTKLSVIQSNEENEVVSVNSDGPNVNVHDEDDGKITMDQLHNDDITTDPDTKSMDAQSGQDQSLKVMNEDDIANLSEFYKNMDSDQESQSGSDKETLNEQMDEEAEEKFKEMQRKKRKSSFWERLFEEFHCVPSWT